MLWEFGLQSADYLRERFGAWDVVLQHEQPAVAPGPRRKR
jgi:hypothetical protein